MLMASSSSIITHQSFHFWSPLKLPLLKNHYVKDSNMVIKTSSNHGHGLFKLEKHHHHHHHHHHLIARAYSEELSNELVEDSKFVPLDAEEIQFGPPAILLLGFEASEAVKIQQLLKEMGGEFLEIIYCTEDMIDRSLWEAMNTKQPNLEAAKIAKSLPRICFLSGLSGEEMMMFMEAFEESELALQLGLEPPIFAALVPNSADKPVRELIEEIMGDHEMVTARNSE